MLGNNLLFIDCITFKFYSSITQIGMFQTTPIFEENLIKPHSLLFDCLVALVTSGSS